MKRISACKVVGMLVFFSVAFLTCKKTADPIPSKIDVYTVLDSLERNSAYLSGTVKSNGIEAIKDRGICWDTIPGVNIRSHTVKTTPDTGHFTVKIIDLVSGKNYFGRAYAQSATQTVYGNEIQFTTTNAPVVTTAVATDINYQGCTAGGSVNGMGSEAILQKGVCWNKAGNPLLTDQKTESGPGEGAFTSVIQGLQFGTKYFLRAYAITIVDTTFGPEITFTTKPVVLPTVFTEPVTEIGPRSATSGGRISLDGGAPILKRGVCWNIAPNQIPGSTGSCSNDGSGMGIFTSSLTALFPFTDYGVVAYATNVAGTAYGKIQTFRTAALAQPGPALLQPADKALLGCCKVNFSWVPNVYAEFYVIQISTSPTFTGTTYSRDVSCNGMLIPSKTGVLENTIFGSPYCINMNNAELNGTWYWRIRFFGAGAYSEWSATRSFTFGM